MALPSAVIEQGTDRVFSYISTKVDEKASRGETIARIEIAVRRIGFVLEKTGKIAITYVSLLDNWNALKRVYLEGMNLLKKYKPRQELDGQVVVRSSSYFHRIAKRAVNLPIFSVVGFVNEELRPSNAKTFEWYVDWAEKKFVADVESSCPLPHRTFQYPFLKHLFDGKTLSFLRKKGKQLSYFLLWPVILEGRGVEALLGYQYFDPKRLDKSFCFILMLRISESTDIVGAAVKYLRASGSLHNPVAQFAEGELNKLRNFQDISDSYDPPWVGIQEFYAEVTENFRPDPLCCQGANGQKHSVSSIMSPESSQIIYPEQTIMFCFQCYIPALVQCTSASVSDEAHRNAMADQRRRPQPLLTRYAFVPHFHLPLCMSEDDCIITLTESKKEASEHKYLPVTITETQEKFHSTIRPNAINHLIEDSELITLEMAWFTQRGLFLFMVTKLSPDDIETASKASGRPKTRSAIKRKR